MTKKKVTAPKVTAPKVTAPVDLTLHFNPITEKPDFKPDGNVHNKSKALLLLLEDGTISYGFSYEYQNDFEYPGTKVKKGDLVHSSVYGVFHNNVVGWAEMPVVKPAAAPAAQ
jgi:hypothetical protein